MAREGALSRWTWSFTKWLRTLILDCGRCTFKCRAGRGPAHHKNEMTMCDTASGIGQVRGTDSQRATVPTEGQGGICKMWYQKV